uniref:ribosomal protein L16 n=1 Tax=Cichorium intybus TaxID=13427 RepID=UPI0022F2A98D|nr:ribosomal protein L16 [Cichorium intybus]WAI96637.1 ribosomal protein L16 [Cichorium intybus]
MLLRKYLLVTESQVSKCGFPIVKKKGDVLYPKRTKYSKYRKGRCSRGCKPDGTRLGFGRYGTKSLRAGRLSYRAIEAARRAIIGQFHRTMSGQFRRNGKIWVRVLADIPITGKPTEVRMGRGKGNPTDWIARVSTGQIPFEMDGVSLSNARQAATLAAHKLCSSTKFVQWS